VPSNFQTKATELADVARGHFKNANVAAHILGASELMDLARRQPKTVFELRCRKSLSSEDGAIVLCKLSDFNAFLRDDNGGVRKSLFESNVRDFQGATEVNAAIRKTLEEGGTPDFWWLNNGVTILASRIFISGDVASIADPQIVNGLQTSTQISNYFDEPGHEADDRSVMIKIVSSDDEEVRDKIIKATNSQNAVQPATLRATDKIQRDIEATLKGLGLFYDRRKNYYKNEGKPADKIVSIPLMAQVLMSILLGRPDDARARPSSLIKDDNTYLQLFSENLPIHVYSIAGILIKRVESYLKTREGLTASDRNNLRFYIATYVIWLLTGQTTPSADEISKIDPAEITDELILRVTDAVLEEYSSLGGTDQVAKGPALKASIRAQAETVILVG
jgi:hypothetical protein